MAYFDAVKDEPQPYVLRYHRREEYVGVRPVWWIRPMPAREFQKYMTRRDNDPAHRRMPIDKVAEAVSNIDEEQLRAVLTKAENIYRDEDTVEGPDHIGTLVEKIDWPTMQELIGAAGTHTVLAEGAKNS